MLIFEQYSWSKLGVLASKKSRPHQIRQGDKQHWRQWRQLVKVQQNAFWCFSRCFAAKLTSMTFLSIWQICQINCLKLDKVDEFQNSNWLTLEKQLSHKLTGVRRLQMQLKQCWIFNHSKMVKVLEKSKFAVAIWQVWKNSEILKSCRKRSVMKPNKRKTRNNCGRFIEKLSLFENLFSV